MRHAALLAFASMLFAGSANADTRTNMTDALEGAEAATGVLHEPSGPNLCAHEQSCSAYLSNVQIAATGFAVDLFVTSQDPVEFYMSACAGALAGLARLDLDSAGGYVVQGFREASSSGDARYEIAGTQMRIRPSSDSRLACEFVRR